MFSLHEKSENLLPEKLRSIKPYTPNTDVGSYIHLDANESPLDIPTEIKNLFFKNLFKIKLNRYPDPSSLELRFAFANRFGVPSSCVVPGNGSDELISVILTSFFQKDDSITVLQPDFSMYNFYGSLDELKIHSLPNDGSVTVDKIISFMRKTKSKGIIFSNPCNPTGGIFSKEDILVLAASVNAIVIVDEAYMDFANETVISRAVELSNIIVLRTMSKRFGSAGLRIGFAVSNPYFSSLLMTAKSPYNINSMSQLMGRLILERLEADQNYLINQRKKLTEIISKRIPYAEIWPSHTNFIYITVPNADRIFYALREKGILIRLFGNSNLRITAGTDDEQISLDNALKEIM